MVNAPAESYLPHLYLMFRSSNAITDLEYGLTKVEKIAKIDHGL
jgi:hypothetical protein